MSVASRAAIPRSWAAFFRALSPTPILLPQVITGALDLTSKVAARAMTPLTKLFMLHTGQHLDERTLRAILASGHSRIPIHTQGDRRNVVSGVRGAGRQARWWQGGEERGDGGLNAIAGL